MQRSLESIYDNAYYIFKYKSKTCKVAWAASPVPWVSFGYLRVKTQCRCLERRNIWAPWSHLTAQWKKNTATKQSRFTQMWTILWELPPPLLPLHLFLSTPFFLHIRFIDFPTEGRLCNERSHLNSLAHIFTLYKEGVIYGEWGNKV